MIVFHPAKPDDATVLFDWLRERLKVGFLRVGHGNRIIVEDLPDKDECWKVAEWVRHNAPVKGSLNYGINGFDEQGRLLYTSRCPLCRDKNVKTPHYEHS